MDSIFWSAYTVFHGEAAYWVIGNRHRNEEIAEKQKIMEAIRSSKPNLLKRAFPKMTNVKIQEILSELMMDKKTSWYTFMALCAFYKFKAIVVSGKTMLDFSPEGDSTGTYLFTMTMDGHASVDLTAISEEKELEIRNTHVLLDSNPEKRMKSASTYKMEDLKEMANTLEIVCGEKWKKTELYDAILEKVKGL